MSSLMDKLREGRKHQASAFKEAAKKRGGGGRDERFWKWSGTPLDKLTDKGKKQLYSKSVIRILPIAPVDMERQEQGLLADHQVLSPVTTVVRHNFKQNGKYYNELSLSMIGGECPVSEHDRPLWDQWKEDGKPDNDVKKTLMKRIADEEQICNILVIDDAAKPENNGKVFLFKMPRAVTSMIKEAMEPSIPGRDPIDPFDFLEGHDLHLEFLMPEQTFGEWTGFAAKDIAQDSYFKPEKTPIGEDDTRIEEVMKQAYSLTEFTDLKLFKDYETLQARFNEVMGYSNSGTGAVQHQAQQANQRMSQQQYEQSTQGTQANNGGQQNVEPDNQSVAQQQSNTESVELDELEAMLQASN